MAKATHPNDFLERIPEEAQPAFFAATVDEDYCNEWLRWLALVFGITLSDERAAAMRRSLAEHHLTNAELGRAGSWIEANAERFPVVSTFIRCPDLGRNSFKS